MRSKKANKEYETVSLGTGLKLKGNSGYFISTTNLAEFLTPSPNGENFMKRVGRGVIIY